MEWKLAARGTLRIKKCFAWFPTIVTEPGEQTKVWLQSYWIVQVYVGQYMMSITGLFTMSERWDTVRDYSGTKCLYKTLEAAERSMECKPGEFQSTPNPSTW